MPIVNVQDIIDSRPISRLQKLVIVLCFAVVAIDGFDTTAVGFIAPAIKAEWGLTPSQLAPLFGSGLLGLMVGAFVLGPTADRYGRRPTLIMTTLFFGIATIASAFAWSIETLIAARFITGVGLGGAMPIAIALTGEFAPERRRASLVTLMFSGFLLGSASAGFVAAITVAQYGWQFFLIITGVVPVVLGVSLWVWLPESLRFQALHHVEPERIASTLARIAPEIDSRGVRFSATPKPPGAPVAHLFRNGLALSTMYLWVTFFMSLLIFYLVSSWLPILITSVGFSLKSASLVSAALAVGGTIGAIVVGKLMDRFNPHWVLAGFYCIAGVFVLLIGLSTSSSLSLVIAVFGVGFGGGGAQVGLNALATALYPTAFRVTGVSWANGIGRFGSVLGSMVGGFLMSMGWNLSTVFAVAAIPALVAASMLLLKSSEVRKRQAYKMTGEREAMEGALP